MSPVPPDGNFMPTPDDMRSDFQEVKSGRGFHQPSTSPILSRSRPCVPKSVHSTSCIQISDSEIPKIPGPPSTPKKMRPLSAYSLDPGAFDNQPQSPSLLDLSNESLENKPLIDMSSPPQRRKSRPLSCTSFDPLMNYEAQTQVQQTSSIPNLTNENYVYPPKIPKIRAPPSSPRKTRPSSTQSLNPFSKQSDFIQFNNQSTSIPNLNAKITIETKTDTSTSSPFLISVEKTPFQQIQPGQVQVTDFKIAFTETTQKGSTSVPYRKKMSISSSSLTLNLNSRKPPMPFDPEQWRKYVEATFPSIQETGECSIKNQKLKGKENSTGNEKIKDKALPQVLKTQRQYSKLKHQSSMDESRHYRVDQQIGNNEANNRLLEKRRIFFLRKQNNSAPDPIDEDEDLPRVSTHVKERNSVNLCLGGRCRARSSDSSILLPTISKYFFFFFFFWIFNFFSKGFLGFLLPNFLPNRF